MNEREASRHWIRERLRAFAPAAGVKINEPAILPLPNKGSDEMLHVEGHRQHVRLEISGTHIRQDLNHPTVRTRPPFA